MTRERRVTLHVIEVLCAIEEQRGDPSFHRAWRNYRVKNRLAQDEYWHLKEREARGAHPS